MLKLISLVARFVGLDQVKLIAIVLAGTFLISVAYLGYNHYTNLVEDNKTLTVNNAKLDGAVKDLKGAVNSLEADNKQMAAIQKSTNDKFQKTRLRNSLLERALKRHDLGRLVKRKPNATLKILNRTTRQLDRCFELATGAKRTAKEAAATKRSQINPHCPELANPKYKGK